MNRRTLGCLFLVALSLGCVSRAPVSKLAQSSPDRMRIKDFVVYFSNRVERAADEISLQTNDPTVNRLTLYWKIRAIPLARQGLLLADDQAAGLHIWLVSRVMRKYFEAKSGAPLGTGQPIAIAASKEIEDQAHDLVATLLTAQQLEQAEQAIKSFVDSNVGKTGLDYTPEKIKGWGNEVSSVLRKPLDLIQAPLSSLNPTSGLSDTALAIQNFTDEFTLARGDVQHMPRDLRWHAELLLLDIEESAHLSAMTEGVGQVGASASSLAETAKNLPRELRAELTAFTEELQQSSVLQSALSEANTTLAGTQRTAAELDAMAATLTETFNAFEKVMEILQAMADAPADPGAPPSTPYDVNDYGRTAEKVTTMADALTALLVQADGIAKTKEPPALLLDAEASARAVVDRALLGAAGLVLFTALVAFGYRAAVSRFHH